MQNAPLVDLSAPAPKPSAAPLEAPHPVPVRVLLAVLSAALLWLALPPVGFAPLALIAIAPFLLALRGLTPREAFRVGIGFGFVSAAANAHWFVNVFPVPFCVALWAIIGIFAGIYAAIHAGLARSSPTLLALGAPAAWIAIDWFRSEVWHLKFAWFTLGHALAGNQVLRQNADMAGVYGLTLFAFVTSFTIERAFAFRKDGRAFVLGLLLVGANLAFAARGNRVLGFAPKDEPRSLSVLAVQDEHFNKIEPKRSLTVAAIGTQAPDVILWPEDSFFVDYTKTKYASALPEIARLASEVFIFGSMREIPGDKREHNAAVVLASSGEKMGEYHKRVPVQFVENCVPGTESPIFPTRAAKLGVMICYDGTYPFVARDLVHAGAEVILVPTMDVAAWGKVQHEHHALFYALRACELRRPIVRAASSGVTLAVDAWGRTVARLEPFDSGTLRAVVHPNDSLTPYARAGWLLPSLAALVALGAVAIAVLKR